MGWRHDRMEADYQIIAAPQRDEVTRQIAEAERFVAEMKRLLAA